PHHEQRTTRRVSATSTTSFSTRSTTTAITRMRRRCRRTDIASGSIRAPSLLGDFDITEYRGALTLTLALPQVSASPTQRAVSERDTPTLVNAPGVTFTHVSLGWSHTCALDTTDRTWCWGSASRGRLGNGANAGTSLSPANVELPDGVTFVALGLGHDHSCAIDTEGLPWCWGSNDRAALGNGTNDD